ncbi:MAG TPA: response regulator, partial [Kofleriaceae bacterium]|nr:response regulator [Kofleriaceae bacterium]
MKSASERSQTRSGPRLLVVEDDEAMRDLLVEELSEAGFEVVAARSGREGIDRVRRDRIDLVITDLRMPDLDGFDLIRDVKATPHSPHIVMITAFGSIETAIKAVKLGAYDYITKPFEIEELVLVADKALEERSLRRQVARLQREVEGKFGLDNIVARSQAMQEILTLVSRVAPSNVSVMVTGE